MLFNWPVNLTRTNVSKRKSSKSLKLVILSIFLGLTLSNLSASSAIDVNRYIVILKSGTNSAQVDKIISDNNVSVQKKYRALFQGFAGDLNSNQVEALKRNPLISLIELDSEVSISAIQNGPTWGLDRIDQRNRPLDSKYEYSSNGSGVRAYVVDTGVLSNHVEFSGRLLPGFTAFSDSVGTSDCNGHGTHVAGTVLGTSYGVAKGASIIPVRVLSCSGSGTTSGVIAGLDWIRSNHPANIPGVANMSLGGSASSSLDLAVRNLVNSGVTVVVAAGNSAANACNSSPAREPLAITVAASTTSDSMASYSNYGSCVDIFAPGSSITSAWYTSSTAINTISGTSMASPHVAGAAALLLQAGVISPADVVARLITDSTKGVVSLTTAATGTANRLLYTNPLLINSISYDPNLGTGSIAATTGDTDSSVTLSNGAGFSRSGYTLSSWNSQANGLGTNYSLGANINMPAGGLNLFAKWSAIGATAPGVPTNVTLNVSGSSTLSGRWNPPADGGSVITGYTVQLFRNGLLFGTYNVSTNSWSLSGASKGRYRIQVRAINSIGAGSFSALSPEVRI